MYTLIVNLSDMEQVKRLAAVITGHNLEWPQDGNTLELLCLGSATRKRIKTLFERDFPPDPNAPLPGQLPLPETGGTE